MNESDRVNMRTPGIAKDDPNLWDDNSKTLRVKAILVDPVTGLGMSLGGGAGAGGNVTVTNFPATQVVSAAALPLPAGAATEATLAALRPAGNGTLLLQTSATITTVSQALTGIPANATFAQLQFHGAGVSARYDAQPASNSAVEEQYAAGGTLKLTNRADILNFNYIGTQAGTFSVIYRTN